VDDRHGDQVVLTETEALELITAVAIRLGMSDDDAEIVARHLVDDELRAAVGMARIVIVADEVAKTGPAPVEPITVERDRPTSAVVHGGGHHGLVVAEFATRLAMSKAQASGLSVVCADQHRYSGTLGYYAELVARAGLVSIVAASGSFGSVAPFGARAGRLDTNPIALGFPTRGEPIVWDIATSAISGSEIHRRLLTGEELPDGVAVDVEGAPTRDPAMALAGAILPWGGHRGSGLAVAIRLLGLLSGAVPFPERGDSFAFFIAVIDPALFLPAAEFEAAAAQLAEGLRATPPAAGVAGVRVPFDRSLEERERRRQAGIPIDHALFDRLEAIRRG